MLCVCVYILVKVQNLWKNRNTEISGQKGKHGAARIFPLPVVHLG